MNTIGPMIDLVVRTAGRHRGVQAVPRRAGIRMVPLESPTPVRTPGLLWKRDRDAAPAVRSFAAIVRRTALRESLARRPEA